VRLLKKTSGGGRNRLMQFRWTLCCPAHWRDHISLGARLPIAVRARREWHLGMSAQVAGPTLSLVGRSGCLTHRSLPKSPTTRQGQACHIPGWWLVAGGWWLAAAFLDPPTRLPAQSLVRSSYLIAYTVVLPALSNAST
jgi:hypothetical protein